MRFTLVNLFLLIANLSFGQSRIDFYQKLDSLILIEDVEGVLAEEPLLENFTNQIDTLAADTYTIFGEAYLYVNDLDKALEYYNSAKKVQEQLTPKESPGYSNTLYSMIFILSELDQYQKAENMAEELLAVDEKVYGKKSPEYFQSVLFYKNVLAKQLKYTQALKLLNRKAKPSDEFDEIELNASKGDIFSQLGNYNDAQEYLEKAASGYIGVEDSLNYIITMSNIGLNGINKGDYAKSEVIFNEAKDMLPMVSERSMFISKEDVGNILDNNMALTHMALGRSDEAIRLYSNLVAKDSMLYGIESSNYISSLSNLGTAYYDTKNFDKAVQVLKKALEPAKEVYGGGSEFEGTLMNNIGIAYRGAGKYDLAIEYFEKARELFALQMGKDSYLYSTATFNAGRAWLLKQSKKAESLLLEALKIRKKTLGDQHPKYAESTNFLGIYYWQQGDFKKARKYFDDTFINYFGQIRQVFPILSEEEKTKFYLEKLKPAFEQYNSLAESIYKDDPSVLGSLYDYQLKTKGVIMMATERLRNKIAASNDTTLVNKFQLWKSTKERLSKLYANNDPRVTLTDSLAELSNKLERELTQQSSDFASTYADIPDWKAVRDKLKPGEVAVELIRYRVANPNKAGEFNKEVHYLALAINKASEMPKAVLLERGDLIEGRYLNNYRNSIKYQIQDDFTYNEMWTPLRGLFGDSKKIYISPDGAYNQINLSTLVNPESGNYLIKEYDLQEVTSTRDLASNKSKGSSSNTKYLFGFPTYSSDKNELAANATRGGTRSLRGGDGSGFSNTRGLRGGLLRYMRSGGSISMLPGTKTEVNKIEQILKAKNTKTYLSEKANESEIKEVKNPEILHIATHGYFLANIDDPEFGESNRYYGNPLLRAGLILAGAEDFLVEGTNPLDSQDGILTAYEVMNMDLSNTDLVVLSACETGLGQIRNGEGVYGLQRAFKIAGADYIVMSMWNVDDDATQKLMTLFYEKLAMDMSKYEAFRAAQLALMDEYEQPFYWGAFKIVGD